KKISH
ncbi:tRNA(Met) cytidine acetyltransferase TmcA, partial [Haemophilus influenzae]